MIELTAFAKASAGKNGIIKTSASLREEDACAFYPGLKIEKSLFRRGPDRREIRGTGHS